jgi:hypothetical protein
MKSHIVDIYNDTRIGTINSNMLIMRRNMFGKFKSVRRAPGRFRLAMFGGDLTIEEFRKHTDKDTGIPNQVSPTGMLGESKILVAVVRDNEKINQINSSTANNDSLRMRREKPKKNEMNNIEGLLGITRVRKG